MSSANRGKYAESKVKDQLQAIKDGHMGFTFNRNLDAHAAGGKFPPQAGDFQAFLLSGLAYRRSLQIEVEMMTTYTDTPVPYSRNFIIEVKEVQHAFRLPYKNYSSDKVARVRVRERAGSACIVLVCHRVAGKNTWRLVPQAFFYARNEATPSGSWDLSEFPLVDYKEAINKFIGLEPKEKKK